MDEVSRAGLLLAHKAGLQRAMAWVRRDSTEAARGERAAGVSTRLLQEAGKAASSVIGMHGQRFEQGVDGTRIGEAERPASNLKTEGVPAANAALFVTGAEASSGPSPVRKVDRLMEPRSGAMQPLAPLEMGTPFAESGSVSAPNVRVVARGVAATSLRPEVRQGGRQNGLVETRVLGLASAHPAAPIVRDTPEGDPGLRPSRPTSEAVAAPAGLGLTEIGWQAAGRLDRRAQSGVATQPGLVGIAGARAPVFSGQRRGPLERENGAFQSTESRSKQVRGHASSEAGWYPVGERGLSGPGAPMVASSEVSDTAARGSDAGEGDQQVSQQQIHGDVFLDGAQVGRWMSRYLSKEAGRAAAGPTGFDSRRNALLPGATVGR